MTPSLRVGSCLLCLAVPAISACSQSRLPFDGAYQVTRVASRLPDVGVSSDGNLLAVPSDKVIQLIRRDGASAGRLEGALEPADAFAFTPEADVLVSSHLPHGDLNMELISWDVRGAGLVARTTIPQGVTSIAVSDDGRFVAAGSQDGRIRVFSLPGLESQLSIATYASWLLDIQFIPGTRRVVGIGNDGSLGVWDAMTGRRLGRRTVGRPLAIAATPTLIAIAGERSLLIDASTLRDVNVPSAGETTAVGFSPDGAEVAFGTSGPAAYVFSTADGKALDSLTCYFNMRNLSALPVAVRYAGQDVLLLADRDGHVYTFARQ